VIPGGPAIAAQVRAAIPEDGPTNGRYAVKRDIDRTVLMVCLKLSRTNANADFNAQQSPPCAGRSPLSRVLAAGS
jgi:hypothetical protein